MPLIAWRKLMAGLGAEADPKDVYAALSHIESVATESGSLSFSDNLTVNTLRVKAKATMDNILRVPYGTDKYDPNPSTPWDYERLLNWTPYGFLYFSPIVGNLVYVIDRGKTNFWSYNLSTKTWAQLANVGYVTATGTSGFGNINRSLALSPDGTKLACVSDATNNYRGGTRIEVYTIAANTWAASSQVQNMNDEVPASRATAINGLVWADEDTIWAWAHEATTGGLNYTRCIKYNIAADTFTIYSTLVDGSLVYAEGRVAAINAAGTVVYGGLIGATIGEWYKYTIATDTYASGGTLTAGSAFAHAVDQDKLPYYNTTTFRQGYIDTADDSENDNKFVLNSLRTAGYGSTFGTNDTWTYVIVHAKSTNPYLMSSKYQSREGSFWVEGENVRFFSETNVERELVSKYDVDDIPVDAVTDVPISSNWAYDHTVTFNDHSARHEDAGADEINIVGLSGVPSVVGNIISFEDNIVFHEDNIVENE